MLRRQSGGGEVRKEMAMVMAGILNGLTWFQLFTIILAGIFVGIADALIKKVSLAGSFGAALTNPWMLAIILLYLGQIILFIYVFINKWGLGSVGVLQVVFYSFTVIITGMLFFGEAMSLLKGTGIAFAIIGVILMNI